MTDCLVEINVKDLQKLKNLYAPNGKESRNYIGFTTINNYISWFQQDPNVKHVKVFCLNGDFSDGTFVVTDRFVAYADTITDSYGRLDRLLQLIDYSKGYKFLSIRTELQSVIIDALKKVNVEVICDTSLLYYLPKEEALKFDVQPPEGIELRPLTELHVEKANSVWPHRDLISLSLLQRLSKYNRNIGAFKELDGTLVAWLLRFPTGLLCALQTDELYYGKGYAGLVTRYVSKKIAETGQDIYAGIFVENTQSRNMFSKYGFKSIGEVHWITTKMT